MTAARALARADIDRTRARRRAWNCSGPSHSHRQAGPRPLEGVGMSTRKRIRRPEITIARSGFLDEVRDLAEGGAFFVVDRNVHMAWQAGLDAVVATSRVHLIEPGEHSKSLASVEALITSLIAAGAHRRTQLVAVG